MRITRLTTIARTGRLMKRSVSFMTVNGSRLPETGNWLTILRIRFGIVARLDRVVHDHRRAWTELERAGAHHFLARFDSGEHRDLIAAGAAELHELLPNAAIGLARLRILDVFDDEHGIAERRVADRRHGKCDRHGLAAAHELSIDEHSGPELARAVIERRLHADVSCRFVDHRVSRVDSSDVHGVDTNLAASSMYGA